MTKILVLTGAGSTQSLGIPGTKKVDDLLRKFSKEQGFKVEGFNDVDSFSVLYNLLDQEGVNPNFETVLSLLSYMAALSEKHSKSILKVLKPSLPVIKSDRPDLNKAYSLLKEYLGEIHDIISSKTKEVEDNAFKCLTELFCMLRRESIKYDGFTLNYDNLLLRAMGAGVITGFDDQGSFDRETLANQTNRCIHLHGSIHLRYAPTLDDIYGLRWSNIPTTSGVMGVQPLLNTGDILIPKGVLVAGGSKQIQLLQEPFASYYNAFVRAVNNADALLVIGYGFMDDHVNYVLKNSFDLQKPIAIVGHTKLTESGDLDEQEFSEFCLRVNNVLGVNIEPSIAEPENGSINLRDSITYWYEGVPNVFRHLADIVDYLQRDVVV